MGQYKFAAAEKKILYKRMFIAALLCLLLAGAAALGDRGKSPEKNEHGENLLRRNGYGEGQRQVEVEAQIGGSREKLTITVGEREYTDDALPKIFEEGIAALEKEILGENKSLDEVRSDLRLITKIPGTGVYVSWRLEDSDIMEQSGKLKEENLKDEGSIQQLHALLSANGKEASHTFYARVFPPGRTPERQRVFNLRKELMRRDEDTKKEAFLILPREIDGEEVKWRYPSGRAAAGLLLLGPVAACGIWVEAGQQKKRKADKRESQMAADYSQIISQLTLFLNAGMTMHAAWVRLADNYENKKSISGARFAYDEVVYSMHEMEQGVSEGECYERFGDRCGLACYRRLGSMLSSNLRKGARGLSQLLKKESADAFEERKNRAKKAGEEAGTKLLGPMFCMLAVVVVVIIIPAFLTIQI